MEGKTTHSLLNPLQCECFCCFTSNMKNLFYSNFLFRLSLGNASLIQVTLAKQGLTLEGEDMFLVNLITSKAL